MKNFTLKSKKELKECKAVIYEYAHESGATLVYYDMDTEEKTFAAAFKTIPQDSTGVFHILEHSILSGSKNYPVASPILFMLKNSMNTFLNAITFKGKTIYPCASCNAKDFENLMKVYLDAVFEPVLSRDTFMREGWHLEKQEDGYLVKGVVYNEMQGTQAMADNLMYYALCEDLYPDTYQRHNSGGSPDAIPDLTYEQYVNTYKEFYSASNSVLFLSGKMDLEKNMEIIDTYLQTASKVSIKHEYDIQKPVITDKVHTYPVANEEALKNNTNMVFSYGIGLYTDVKKLFAVQILSTLLMENNSSVLKAKLMGSGLMKNADASVLDGAQSAYILQVYQTEAEHKARIVGLINETVLQLIENGIDKNSLRAIYSKYAFRVKENLVNSRNQGVNVCINIASNAFYGAPLDTYLELDDVLNALEQAIDTDYYERILKEVFIDNDHRAVSLLVPEVKNAVEEQKRAVERVLSSMSEEEIDAAIKEYESFAQRQSGVDSPEAVAQMPTLSITDLDGKVETKNFETFGNIMYSKAETNGIDYVRLYFPLKGLNEEELMLSNLLTSALSVLPTSNYESGELSDMIKLNIGRLKFEVTALASNTSSADAYLVVSLATFDKNVEKSVEIVKDILLNTVFTDDGVKNVLLQELTQVKMSFAQNGVVIAMNQAVSNVSAVGKYNVIFTGYDYYKFIQSYAERSNELCSKMKAVADKIFVLNGLKIGVTGGENLKDIKIQLPLGEEIEEYIPSVSEGNVAFDISAQVNFDVQAMDYSDILPYSGKHLIMSKLLSLGYLWHNIREKGGAYGTRLSFGASGALCVYSYRDPSVKETYDIYSGIAEYLKNIQMSEKELNGYVISAVAELINPKGLEAECVFTEREYLVGRSPENIQKLVDEAMSFTKEDIADYIALFEKFALRESVCSVGNGAKLKESGIFEKIINI